MSVYDLNRAIHHIYTDRDRTMAFRSGDYGELSHFDLTSDERTALEGKDFPRLWALHVHPVLLFHLSAVLNPREWYLQEVVPKIKGVPNYWYDYYSRAPDHAPVDGGSNHPRINSVVTTDDRQELPSQPPPPNLAFRGGLHIGIWRLLVLVILVALWTVVARYAGQNFIPSPIETALAAGQLIADGTVIKAAMSSLYVFLIGYLLAIVIAIPLGLLMGGFRVFGAALEPFVDAFSAMPRVAFIPLIIVFLGLGSEAKIFVVLLGAIMPILVNTYVGVLNSDRDLIEMAKSAGATDFQIFRKIMLPDAMPYVLAGMRIGAALALVNTVVAELYTAVQGLGGLLAIYGNSFRMAPYFVVVFVLGAVGLMTVQSLKLIEQRLNRSRRLQA